MRHLLRAARVAAALAIAVPLGACGGRVAAPAVRATSLQDRIARGIAEASPPADPADAAARDVAAEKLARLVPLLEAAGDRILWGGMNPEKGYSPAGQSLTQLSPVVWAKLYLSTFMFTGAYEVRAEGDLTVVELGARFRDRLDAGDYPYPFWHSAEKWRAYVGTRALMLIFDRDRLVAAYRKARPAGPDAPRRWDGRWRWTDERGVEQPRVTLFQYLLSADNPSVAKLDGAYRSLEEALRRNNCSKCHAPDNAARSRALTLLDFPNQALVARHSLVETLRRNAMPPGDVASGVAPGVHDTATQAELVALAERFEREADTALAFERERAATRMGAPKRH